MFYKPQVPVVLYVRVSSDKQREAHTIQGQIEALTRFCEQHGIAVTAVYQDDGFSGDLPFLERPGGTHLLEDAKAGKFKTVLVYLYDRFSRDVYEGLTAARLLKAAGAIPFSISEPFDINTPHGQYMFVQSLNNAQLWKQQFLERSKDGMARRAREGTWLNGIPPFGYKREGQGHKTRIVIDTEPILPDGRSAADIVRYIYHLIAEEHKSCQGVADHFNREGIPPPAEARGQTTRRASWWSTTVYVIVTATTYKGIHQYGRKGKTVTPRIIEREVPALVDEALWQRAQAALKSNALNATRNAKREYLLRGMVKCAHCGLTYQGTGYYLKDGRERRYYSCGGKLNTYKNAIACGSKAISADLETMVWEQVVEYLRDPGPVLAQISAQQDQSLGDADAIGEQSLALLRAAEGKQSERDVLITLARKGRITEDDLERQLKQVAEEEAHLRSEAARLQGRAEMAAALQRELGAAEALLREMASRLQEVVTTAEKRRVLEALVESIVVTTTGEGGQHQKKATVRVTYRFTEAPPPPRPANRIDTIMHGPP